MVDVSHVAQAMNGMRESFARMEGALNRVCEQLAESMPHPDECHGEVCYAERRAEPFRHTDRDGDTLEVAPVHPGASDYGFLYAHKVGAGTVIFDQTAVNELAQYLDRYRTDVPCTGLGVNYGCAGTQNHGGLCAEEADDIGAGRCGRPPSHLIGALCAGHFPDRAADKTGCNCFREVHGALGCTVPGCPCERRGGR